MYSSAELRTDVFEKQIFQLRKVKDLKILLVLATIGAGAGAQISKRGAQVAHLADLDTPEETLSTSLGVTKKPLHPQADKW